MTIVRLALLPLSFSMLVSCGSDPVERAPLPPQHAKEKAPTQETDSALAEPGATSPFLEIMQCFESLDFKGEDNVGSCLEAHREEWHLLTPGQADSLYLMSFGVLRELMDKEHFDYEEHLDRETWDIRPDVVAHYKKYGVEVTHVGEGFFELLPSKEAIRDWFTPIVSEDMKAYLAFDAKYGHQIVFDAGLGISEAELANRIVEYERFLSKHEVHPELETYLIDNLAGELQLLMTGVDNTPAFSWDGSGPDSLFMAAWNTVMASDAKISAQVMKEYYQYLESNGMKREGSWEFARGLPIADRLKNEYEGYPEFLKR